jgi:capsular polysaccharide biosynthesis protein
VSVLLQEVEAAQKAYDAVSQRMTETSLESQSSQTNISVLTTASVPTQPSSPKVPLNLALALVAGLLLGVGVAVIQELLDRRIRSTQDMVDLIGLPVLGVISAFGNAPRKHFNLLPYGGNRSRGLTSGA